MISYTIGTTVSTIVFISYVTWITIKWGILPSISDSYYKHKNKLLFLLFMTGVGLPITLMATNGLMFFSGVFFILCGCAPAFKYNKLSFEDEMHAIGAITGILLLIIYFITINIYNPLILFPIYGLMYLFNLKNKTFFIEITSFIILLTNLYLLK